MGLFVKKTSTESRTPLYSVSLGCTVLIVGLGNTGAEYDHTRHNIGFYCTDFIAENNDFPAWTLKKDLKAQVSSHNLGDTRVILVKPTTFMNNSGEAVQAVQNFYKIQPEQTVIIHDELDIPFGQIRTRNGGGSAGHNGIKSVIQHGGENAMRIRIGIQNDITEHADSADFVLGKFKGNEQDHLKTIAKEVNAVVNEYIFGNNFATETRTIAT
jgi:PTH1 family peptidyl-tRNA hydrolase